jgi:hypothetical protein
MMRWWLWCAGFALILDQTMMAGGFLVLASICNVSLKWVGE